ncbi:kinase-like domain-containing protein [Nemania abortiva]|nr:kinase-like domain-containing protein [Nemania abortiva]
MDQPPQDGATAIAEKPGTFIWGGTAGLVYLLPSGDAIKSPWPGGEFEEFCRKAIRIEASIYQHLGELLGEHPRLLKMKHWDPSANTITLEYMENGTLQDYVKGHFEEISLAQKISWSLEATDAVELLHSSGVIHCDIQPLNFLLDENLSLKIMDFSGSSLNGSRAIVCPGPRYCAPNLRSENALTVDEDLFSLGSTLYFIMTGKAPYEELLDHEVEDKYREGEFPDLGGIPCAEAIASTWRQEVSSARSVRAAIEGYIAQTTEPEPKSGGGV